MGQLANHMGTPKLSPYLYSRVYLQALYSIPLVYRVCLDTKIKMLIAVALQNVLKV